MVTHAEPVHSARVLDGILAAAVVALTALAYLAGLGFYSDDWAFLASLERFSNLGFIEQFQRFSADQYLAMRPGQALYLTALFRAFGTNPLGYHLVNLTVLMAMSGLGYAALVTARAPRAIALSAALIFALLPHYSTDRFWVATVQAPLAMGLFFVSLIAGLRALQGRAWLWMPLSLAALAASLMLYEVTLGLLVGQCLYLAWRSRRLGASWVRAAAPQAAGLAVIAAIFFYKSRVTDRLGDTALIDRITQTLARLVNPTFHAYDRYGLNIRGALETNFGDWLVLAPRTLARAVAFNPEPVAIAAALAVAVLVFLRLRKTPYPWTLRRVGAGLAIGAILSALGYAPFLLTPQLNLTAAGVGNRVNIGAALGVAVILSSLAGLAPLALPAPRRSLGFAGLTALTCGVYAFLLAALGQHWEASWVRQLALVDEIVRTPFPPSATLLLDGTCPYDGPAPVFESSWDLQGALAMRTGVSSMKADVVTASTTFGPLGVTTEVYGGKETYPYGPGLLLHHPGLAGATPLASYEAAQTYLARAPRAVCPPYAEGWGAPAFQNR